MDQPTASGSKKPGQGKVIKPKFGDAHSIMGYFRGLGLSLYCQCHFVRRVEEDRFKKGFPVSDCFHFSFF
jgi:hypothetical protein